jgi:hypothetical protein
MLLDSLRQAAIMSPIPLSLGAIWKRDVLPKPSDPDGLVLEAWAQGYMVGSLIIMAFITMANMRRGILLHKVRLLFQTAIITTNRFMSSSFFLRYESSEPCRSITSNHHLACSRYLARLLVVLPYAHLRMVALDRRHIPQRFLVATQCYLLDED